MENFSQDLELEGNIKLAESGVHIEEADNSGFRSESTSAETKSSDELHTLDEPVSATIVSFPWFHSCQKRDLMRIWTKLRIVINPIKPVAAEADKRKEIRNWDLWGPFFFCLMLAR